MKKFKKTLSLITTISMLSAGIVIPASEAATIRQAGEPDTPLSLFCDTMDHLSTTDAPSLLSIDSDISSDDIWEISSSDGANINEQYSIVNTDGNNAVALTPMSLDGAQLCLLSMKDTINFLGDYVLNVDVSTEFDTATSVAGIRISHPYDDTSYYELAFMIDQGIGKPRFTKVEGATADTLSTPDQWVYHEYGDEKDISSYSWLKVFLAKKDDTVYWSVVDKANSETLWFGLYEDKNPVFADLGRLQLFAYSTDENSASVLFDNVDAKKLGATFFKDYSDNSVKVEASWVNDSNNPPIIAVANYDDTGRLLNVQRLEATDGYYISNEGIDLSGTETKLFVWDGATNQPIYDVAVYEDTDVYQVPAEEYVYQYNRGYSTFESGNGIKLDTLGTVRVSPMAELFVNGIKYVGELVQTGSDMYGNPIYSSRITNEVLDKFLGNAQGNIKFVRTNPDSREYDQIYVDYYEIGKVTMVSYRNGKTTIKLILVNDSSSIPSMNLGAVCTIEIDDSEVQGGYVDLYAEKNKKSIALKDIEEGDIIALATDFNGMYGGLNSVTIKNPEFIRVLATNKTVTGMIYDYDDDYRTYTIENTTYKCVDFNYGLDVATTYEITLDPFGRIIENESTMVSTGARFAIVEKYDSNSEMVTMLLDDGTKASYMIHPNSSIGTNAIASFIKTAGMLNPVQDRVVTYTVRNGEVRLTAIAPMSSLYDKEYNPNTGKLGAVPITEHIKIINAQAHEESASPSITDYEVFDASEIKAGVEYDGYAYKTGDVFGFIILTNTGATFTKDSRFAVITKNPMNKIYDGYTCVGAEALYNGEPVTLYWDTANVSAVPYGEGDVIYFTVDSEGFIKSAHKIYDKDTGINTAQSAFSTMPTGAYRYMDWAFSFAKTTADIQLVSGYITDIDSTMITFGVPSSQTIDGSTKTVINGNKYNDAAGYEGMFTFGIDSDCQAYVFDHTFEVTQNYKKYSAIDVLTLIPSMLVEAVDPQGNNVDYVYDTATSTLNDAMALIVNGNVVEIFVNQRNAEMPPALPDVPAEAPTINFAIVEKYNSSTEEVTMLLADGTKVSYVIHSSSSIGINSIASFIKTSGFLRPVQDRVVAYTIKNDAVMLTDATLTYNRVSLNYEKYNANTGRLGPVPITDYIKIINAQAHEESTYPSISDYEIFDSASLKADVEYTGYAYKVGDAYSFMILTDTGAPFTKESRFAVITKDPMNKIYDGATCVGVEALYNGEAITLYWDVANTNQVPYGEGDVIFFTTDSEGYIKSAHKIYDRDNNQFDGMTNIPSSAYVGTDWAIGFADTTADIQLVAGVVAEVKNNAITFAVKSTDPTYGTVIDGNIYEQADGLAGMYTFGIASDAQAYIFDGAYEANQNYKKYAVVDGSAIVESNLVEVVDQYGYEIDYVYDIYNSNLNEAVAMVVDGDVVCIFVNYPL